MWVPSLLRGYHEKASPSVQFAGRARAAKDAIRRRKQGRQYLIDAETMVSSEETIGTLKVAAQQADNGRLPEYRHHLRISVRYTGLSRRERLRSWLLHLFQLLSPVGAEWGELNEIL
jgi:hypothetical protein